MNTFLNPNLDTTQQVELCSAIEVFQGLSAASTSGSLFDAMLGLALDYAHGPQAWMVVQGQVQAYASALALHGGVDQFAPLPVALAAALQPPPAPAVPAVLDCQGSTALLISVVGASGRQHAVLCLVQAEAPSQQCLQTLILIAACGGALLDNMMGSAPSALQAENAALKSQVRARLALASHLADERGLLRTLIDNMPDQIYVKDTNGRFIVGNQAAAACIGVAAPADLIGKSDLEFFPGECGQRFFRDEQLIMQSGRPIVDQLEENINAAGVHRWFSTTKVPFKDEQGNVVGIVGMSRDVSLRVAADEAIRLRNRAIEASLDAIVITDCTSPDNPVVYVNPAFERITGFSVDEACRDGISGLLEGAADDDGPAQIRAAMQQSCEVRAVLHSMRKDGTRFWNEVRIAPVCDLAGKATHFIFTMTDITRARATEEQLERLASHDILTGLPNRRMLMDRLGQAIAMGERGHFVVAVAFIDLDGLKGVNDNLGHEAGDVLLKEVAARMERCVRKTDTVARLGGDEFVLISLHNTMFDAVGAPGLGNNYAFVSEMLGKIQKVLAEPIALAGAQHSVTASIGVSIYPQHGADPETLLKHADSAMYSAKKNGRNRIKFYSNDPARL
ncbi:MAG: diguanylate cyclase [Pseudomonadota bacterium]